MGSKTAFQCQAATAPIARKMRTSRRVARRNLLDERAVGASPLFGVIGSRTLWAKSTQFPIRATSHPGEAVEPLAAVAKLRRTGQQFPRPAGRKRHISRHPPNEVGGSLAPT